MRIYQIFDYSRREMFRFCCYKKYTGEKNSIGGPRLWQITNDAISIIITYTLENVCIHGGN